MKCPLPYTQRLFNPDQTISICCNAPKGYNMTLQEFNDSAELQSIKDQLEQDIWPDECSVCKNQEEQNMESMRLGSLPNYNDYSKVQFYDIKFSNKCNLSCRMCSPMFSSKLATEQNQDYKYQHISEEAMQDIKLGMHDLNEIIFAGGEPTIIPEVMELMEYCVEHDFAKNISVAFVTNGLKLNHDMLTLAGKFKARHFTISIDGIGELQEYARYGSVWSEQDKNTRELVALDHSIAINTTITAYNVPYIHTIFDYLIELNKISGRPVQHWATTVMYPTEMSPFVYKGEKKEILQVYLRKVYEKYNVEFLKEVMQDLDHDWDPFVTFTKDYDLLRNQDSSHLFWNDLETWKLNTRKYLD